MRVTSAICREAVAVDLAITDGEIRDVPHSTTGRLYVVGRVQLEYRRVDGGEWRVITSLSGHVLKKDGKPGLNPARESYSLSSKRPQWLVDLIDHYQPTTPTRAPMSASDGEVGA